MTVVCPAGVCQAFLIGTYMIFRPHKYSAVLLLLNGCLCSESYLGCHNNYDMNICGYCSCSMEERRHRQL